MTLVRVRPTQRWHSRLIQVPHVGPVYRPRANGRTALEFDVEELAIPYLTGNHFVTLVEAEAGKSSAQDSNLDSDQGSVTVPSVDPLSDNFEDLQVEEIHPASVDPENVQVTLDEFQELAVEPVEEQAEEPIVREALQKFSVADICSYINGKNRPELMALRGVGTKAAGDIVRAQPLTEETLLSVLKENQIQSIIEAMRLV